MILRILDAPIHHHKDLPVWYRAPDSSGFILSQDQSWNSEKMFSKFICGLEWSCIVGRYKIVISSNNCFACLNKVRDPQNDPVNWESFSVTEKPKPASKIILLAREGLRIKPICQLSKMKFSQCKVIAFTALFVCGPQVSFWPEWLWRRPWGGPEGESVALAQSSISKSVLLR